MTFAQFVKKSLQAAGWELSRHRPLKYDPFAAQQKLLVGRECMSIFDIGAFHGEVTETYAQLFPRAKIYAFEPFPASFEELKKRFQGNPHVEPVNCAVSSRSGTSTFHVNQDPTTNSLLATGEGFVAGVAVTERQISVPTTTLDEFCAQRGIGAPDILKFDIQGNELEALRGAVNLLRGDGPLLVYTEVLFEPLYQNCAQFSDLVNFLGEYDYKLFNFYSLKHAPDGRLEFGDALFVSQRLRGA